MIHPHPRDLVAIRPKLARFAADDGGITAVDSYTSVIMPQKLTDALRLQALKRMEGGRLTEAEVNRLGEALMDLDGAVQEMKAEQGITESVKSVRDGLDHMVDELLDKMVNPERFSPNPHNTH